MRQIDKENKKSLHKQPVFVAILMACFGDVILSNSLFQNIKALYPDAKTVFIVDKPWYEAAKYQKDVDEVYLFDKRGENNGIGGILKFIRNFPYKKIDYIFKIYDNFRVDIISFLFHPKKIIGKKYYNYDIKVQERHANLLKAITDREIKNFPITYLSNNEIPTKFENIFQKDKKYVALCTTTKQDEKDMPIDTAAALVNILNENGYEVIYTGAGAKAKDYAQKLKDFGCKFINLTNQTTIFELSHVLRNCTAAICADTGTMHFSYANKVPTVCVFYKSENLKEWAPRKELYSFTTILSKPSEAQEIYDAFTKLTKELTENKG